jgi:enoyl-CoA hydratase
MVQEFGKVMLRVFGFPRPVVAAVTGHAMGAGAILALASDVRLQAEGTFRFAMNEVVLGMTVPTFGCEIARATVIPPVHAELVLHGRTFSPTELLARGMVETLLPPDQVEAKAMERARGLAELNPVAYAATKMLMRGAALAHASAINEPESHVLVKPFLPPA